MTTTTTTTATTTATFTGCPHVAIRSLADRDFRDIISTEGITVQQLLDGYSKDRKNVLIDVEPDGDVSFGLGPAFSWSIENEDIPHLGPRAARFGRLTPRELALVLHVLDCIEDFRLSGIDITPKVK